jgi:hypothetical protein
MDVYARDLGLSIAIVGQRHSGEEAGSIGNSFNASAVCCGAVLRTDTEEASVVVTGDDLLILARGPWTPTQVDNPQAPCPIPQAMIEVSEDHGMQVEVCEPAPHMATFLQTRYPEDPATGQFIPFPKLGRYLAKVNVRVNSNPGVSDKDLMSGKYLSLAYMYRFLPKISGRFYNASCVLSETPVVETKGKAWKPMTAEAMRLAYHGVKHPTSVESEADLVYKIYQVSLSDVLDDIDAITASCLVRLLDPRTSKAIRDKLPMRVKSKIAHGDLDGSTMQALLLVDCHDPVFVRDARLT